MSLGETWYHKGFLPSSDSQLKKYSPKKVAIRQAGVMRTVAKRVTYSSTDDTRKSINVHWFLSKSFDAIAQVSKMFLTRSLTAITSEGLRAGDVNCIQSESTILPIS